MALHERNGRLYADAVADVPDAIMAYPDSDAEHFVEAVCKCGATVFELYLNEDAAYCARFCVACEHEHTMFGAEAKRFQGEVQEVECICGGTRFEVVGAVNVYPDNPDDARQFVLGCRCVGCGCAGVYATWMARWRGWRSYLAML